MLEMQIIGKDIESVDEFHDKIQEELEFPDYYGANLDALYDMVSMISEETYIEMDLSDMEDEAMKTYLKRVWNVLCDAAEENLCLEIRRVDDEE
ncbi:MAG: barstar family protein [Clostridiales bacterium]|nr:barstar family protein [Candidatus Blautia equi]